MSGGCKSKAELVAIYRLEFYRKQKSWKFCSDLHREPKDKASIKNSLNETYDVEQAEAGEGGEAGGSQSELNQAFVDSGPDKESPSPESHNTPQSWPEHDPNQTQDEWPSVAPPQRVPTPPPYPPPKPLPQDLPEVWSQPVTWESHQYTKDIQYLREKCPELNRSYTKIDWVDSEKIPIYSEDTYPEGFKDWQEEWKPQEWAGCGATWSEPAWAEGGEPELAGGGEDVWPITGWEVPGVTDAVWSEDVARELATLAARAGRGWGPADDLLYWLLDDAADVSRDQSADQSADSAGASFTRGAHVAPHSSETDLRLDTTDEALCGRRLWALPQRALECRGRRLARALRRVALELRARRDRAGTHDMQQSGSSADTEPTRDVGLWGPPGDALLAGSHRHRGARGAGSGGDGGHGGVTAGDMGVTGGSQYLTNMESSGHSQHINDGGLSNQNRGNQLLDHIRMSHQGYSAGLGRGHHKQMGDAGLGVTPRTVGAGVEAGLCGVKEGRGRGRLPRGTTLVGASRPLR